MIVITAIALAIGPGGREPVFGLPAVRFFSAEPAWLSIGGTGVLVLFGGAGVVVIGFYGIGVLFSIGQISAALITIAQLGIGLLLAVVQVGAGLTGLGQLIGGVAVAGQLPIGFDGRSFLEELSRELDEALRLPLGRR